MPTTPAPVLKQWQTVLLAVPQTAPGQTAADLALTTGVRQTPAVVSTAVIATRHRGAVVERTAVRPYRYVRVVDDATILRAPSLAALQRDLAASRLPGAPLRATPAARPTHITVTTDRHGQRHALLAMRPGARTAMAAAGLPVEDWPLLTPAHDTALAALRTLAAAPETWTLADVRRVAGTAVAGLPRADDSAPAPTD